MDPNLNEWLNLTLRWFHLIAGIMWIGSSFFFVWLDSNLEAPKGVDSTKASLEGELWMVHSGGFYEVKKCKPGPGEMPEHLHWFKWEATFTWISGFLLLCLVYYLSNGIYLIDPQVSNLSAGAATLVGLACLTGSWFVYDLLFQSPLAKNGKVAAAISLMLLFALIYGLCHVFSGRGAFIHLGAIFGTIMVLNVWVRILPAQTQMIDATRRSEMPDFNLGLEAKRRSMHNSYMTLPVLFMMISNHYAALYGAELNWLVLVLLVVVGSCVRHYMIVKHGQAAWVLAPVIVCLVALWVLTSPKPVDSQSYAPSRVTPSLKTTQEIISRRCLACHSINPTDQDFPVAPAGITFDTPELIEAYADRIKARAVVSKTMPLRNKTGITTEERVLLGKWLETISPIEE
ncbi:MAG: urate hydroxylase PuuD [Candidatus Melainabacteria bacterium]|nr:urate hydroxylase PuuD [Candidatus Melainabacteria bacterium]